jgi:hypothetical protein
MNVAERKPLPCPSDWTFELLEEYDTHIAQVAEQYGSTPTRSSSN